MLKRLDKLLVERQLFPSREAAQEAVRAGDVQVGGFVQNKPASLVQEDVRIDVRTDGAEKWVSRGAHKLIRGLDEWHLNPSGFSCVDIGASTGGFTQVLLSRGAARVAAVDVGYGQLAWVLRNDPRVRIFERTNARYITTDEIGWPADLVTVDASFISLRLLLPNLATLMVEGGRLIALVKPQFEVGRERIGKGVVRDPALHVEVLCEIGAFVLEMPELSLVDATYSPIRGPEGNIEFIFLMTRSSANAAAIVPDFDEIVREAHEKAIQ